MPTRTTNRGNAYYHKGDDDRAIADYSEAIRLDPKYAQAYFNRGIANLYAGWLLKALADLGQSSALNPKYAYAALWLNIVTTALPPSEFRLPAWVRGVQGLLSIHSFAQQFNPKAKYWLIYCLEGPSCYAEFGRTSKGWIARRAFSPQNRASPYVISFCGESPGRLRVDDDGDLVCVADHPSGRRDARTLDEVVNPDFAALARACGGHGFRATKPGELNAEINEAFNVAGPAIIDCVVAADEMPNFPHLELDKLGHYAVAKIEALTRRPASDELTSTTSGQAISTQRPLWSR